MLIHCLKNEVDHALLSVGPSLFSPIVLLLYRERSPVHSSVQSSFHCYKRLCHSPQTRSYSDRLTGMYIREKQLHICKARYYFNKTYIWS